MAGGDLGEWMYKYELIVVFFFQAEDGIRDVAVTGVQTCALPISSRGGQRDQGAWGRAPDAATDRRAAWRGSDSRTAPGHRAEAPPQAPSQAAGLSSGTGHRCSTWRSDAPRPRYPSAGSMSRRTGSCNRTDRAWPIQDENLHCARDREPADVPPIQRHGSPAGA